MRDRSIEADDAHVAGSTLPGGLRILDPMGATPDGTLYHAEYPSGLKAALLLAPPESGEASAARRERLERASEIQHVNVARIYEVGALENGELYAVLEKVTGEPLSALLAGRRILPLPEAVDIALQAAAGLHAAHRAGFVHGNLSADAILVGRPIGADAQVKLIGFELDPARRRAGVPLPLRPQAFAYASPERLDGHPPDERADIFSLGAVFHQLLTGEPPGSEDAGPIPRPARSVLATALASDPARRFASIAAFHAALERLAGRTAARAARGGRRLRAGGVLGAAAAVVLVVGALVFPRAASPPETETGAITEPSAAPAPAPSPPKADSIARPAAPPAAGRPARATPAPAVARSEPRPRAERPRSPPATEGTGREDPDIEGAAPEGAATDSLSSAEVEPRGYSAMETDSTPTPTAPEPPSMEDRARVYLRIGLDEARQQLGRPAHALEGMSPLLYGLAPGGEAPFTDTTRPVVRSVYVGPNGQLILLDQQRVRRGVAVPVRSENILRRGDIILRLHGEAQPEVLRNFLKRVR